MDKPALRIAILLPFTKNEAWDAARELALRLAGAGHTVTLFNTTRTARAHGPGLREVRVPVPYSGLLAAGVGYVFSLIHAARGFDLVYLSSPTSVVGMWPLISRTPLWINFQDAAPARGVWQRLRERLALAVAHTVVLETQATGEALRERHHKLPDTCIIPPAIEVAPCADPEPLVDYELVPNCYYLTVCRPAPEYHVREIVEGFLAAPAAFPLVIVGDFGRDTSYARELRFLAGARVRFIGSVDDPGRLRLLRCHARACFHGRALGGCGDLLEVLGCGSPIIALDSPVNRELAGDLARYFTTAAEIPAAVAWAEDLDGEERHARAGAAREKITAMHNWERITALYLDSLGNFACTLRTPN